MALPRNLDSYGANIIMPVMVLMSEVSDIPAWSDTDLPLVEEQQIMQSISFTKQSSDRNFNATLTRTAICLWSILMMLLMVLFN